MNSQKNLFYKILSDREDRVKDLIRLNKENSGTVICFTVNMPGSNKLTDDSYFIFNEGILGLSRILNTKTLKIEKRFSGFECYFISNKSPIDIKKIAVKFEETHPLGRLFDIDVFYKNLEKISREDLNFPKRKCLLCSNEAVQCARSRKHSLEELKQFIHKMVCDYKIIINKQDEK